MSPVVSISLLFAFTASAISLGMGSFAGETAVIRAVYRVGLALITVMLYAALIVREGL
jgi:hypothetical protein